MNEKSQKHVRVLVIEDNDVDAHFVHACLNQDVSMSFKVKRAETLNEAKTLLHGVRFDVIVADLNLPDGCGIQCLEEIEQLSGKTPIIIFTGQDEDSVMQEAVQKFRVYDYLVKSDISAGVIRRSIKYAMTKREAEIEQDRLKSELRHSQKMEMIGQLSGGIAHDFNNKLAIISGNIFNASALIGDEQHPANECLENAQQSVTSAAQLTKQLLNFSRKQEKGDQTVNLDELVEKSVNVLKGVVGSEIDLQFSPSGEEFLMCLSPTQIDQVVMNLIINARDAMESGGKIEVGISRVTLEHTQATAPVGVELCRLQVKDNGSGMSKATLQHIFEPFFTTKDAEKGTGLGLSVVNRMVAELGGHIHVSSQLGVGSTFDIYFELNQAVEQQAA